MGKCYIRKVKIYLNDVKPKTFIVDRELKLWQINSVKLTVYRVTFEHIIVQSENKTSYYSFPKLKNYWNERISCQRTIIHVSVRHGGGVCIL